MSKPNLYMVEGGVGKHLQFTSLIEGLYNKDKNKLVINSYYPELFNNHPLVADSRDYKNEIIFDAYFQYYNKYSNLYFQDPYRSNFLKGQTHIMDEWAKLYNIQLQDKRPNFFINTERETVLIPHIKKLKNIILLQFTGGQGIETKGYDKNNLGRNYKYGQELIYLLQSKYPEHYLLVFGHDNEKPRYDGETVFKSEEGFSLFKNREDFIILSKYCNFFIAIDSSLQHICSNINVDKKGIVLWGTTDPLRFGYENNINLKSSHPYCVEISPHEIIRNTDKL
tara:strand:+ start:1223 stop:2065 length:843 start_codon:yes stop_codon:yes gene_type:complete